MQGHIKKLAHVLDIPASLAEQLWKAGYRTPKDARKAKLSELRDVPGVTPALARKIKGE